MSIPTLRRGDNGFFYAFWSEGRRSKRETMGTKEEAEATRRFAQWLMIEGQRDSTLPSPPLSDLWGLYREKHVVASAHHAKAQRHAEKARDGKDEGERDAHLAEQARYKALAEKA